MKRQTSCTRITMTQYYLLRSKSLRSRRPFRTQSSIAWVLVLGVGLAVVTMTGVLGPGSTSKYRHLAVRASKPYKSRSIANRGLRFKPSVVQGKVSNNLKKTAISQKQKFKAHHHDQDKHDVESNHSDHHHVKHFQVKHKGNNQSRTIVKNYHHNNKLHKNDSQIIKKYNQSINIIEMHVKGDVIKTTEKEDVSTDRSVVNGNMPVVDVKRHVIYQHNDINQANINNKQSAANRKTVMNKMFKQTIETSKQKDIKNFDQTKKSNVEIVADGKTSNNSKQIRKYSPLKTKNTKLFGNKLKNVVHEGNIHSSLLEPYQEQTIPTKIPPEQKPNKTHFLGSLKTLSKNFTVQLLPIQLQQTGTKN